MLLKCIHTLQEGYFDALHQDMAATSTASDVHSTPFRSRVVTPANSAHGSPMRQVNGTRENCHLIIRRTLLSAAGGLSSRVRRHLLRSSVDSSRSSTSTPPPDSGLMTALFRDLERACSTSTPDHFNGSFLFQQQGTGSRRQSGSPLHTGLLMTVNGHTASPQHGRHDASAIPSTSTGTRLFVSLL